MARNIKHIRENIRFIAGLAGLLFETAIEHADRPVLLAIFAGMIGLDVVTTTLAERDSE